MLVKLVNVLIAPQLGPLVSPAPPPPHQLPTVRDIFQLQLTSYFLVSRETIIILPAMTDMYLGDPPIVVPFTYVHPAGPYYVAVAE